MMIKPFEGYWYVFIGKHLTVHLLKADRKYKKVRCGIRYVDHEYSIEKDFKNVMLRGPTNICANCHRSVRPGEIKFLKRVKRRPDIHTIVRRLGTDEAANAGHAYSGSEADAYIASWLNDGWELKSVHLLDSVHIIDYPPTNKRWWEIWKPKHIEIDYGHAYDIMWVLVR